LNGGYWGNGKQKVATGGRTNITGGKCGGCGQSQNGGKNISVNHANNTREDEGEEEKLGCGGQQGGEPTPTREKACQEENLRTGGMVPRSLITNHDETNEPERWGGKTLNMV